MLIKVLQGPRNGRMRASFGVEPQSQSDNDLKNFQIHKWRVTEPPGPALPMSCKNKESGKKAQHHLSASRCKTFTCYRQLLLFSRMLRSVTLFRQFGRRSRYFFWPFRLFSHLLRGGLFLQLPYRRFPPWPCPP